MLTLFSEVLDEVMLAVELAREFRGGQVSLLGAFKEADRILRLVHRNLSTVNLIDKAQMTV